MRPGAASRCLLAERDDLAAHTSSSSTKLIHGGLRYLEHLEFRLVAEALAEREVLLRAAPHLIEPLLFVLPHEPHLRPKWMIRAGLFLYDRLGGRMTLPKSFATRLDANGFGAGLKPGFASGFVYADARVDDARLVVVNAIAARERGADIRVCTALMRARRQDGLWHATLAADGATSEVVARALVNAAGPWVAEVLDRVGDAPGDARVRHIKGSHIVVPRVHAQDHAYILQNADQRIVFIIPYQDRYSLIGTTDIPVDEFEHPEIGVDETDYLLALANAYLVRPLARRDVVWSYSGVRPLYDDGAQRSIGGDARLRIEGRGRCGCGGGHRPRAAAVGVRREDHHLPEACGDRAWRPAAIFPGDEGRVDVRRAAPRWRSAARRPCRVARRARQAISGARPELLRALAKRHGTRAPAILGDARKPADLGEHYGAQLTEREVDYLVRDEWARTAADVLWRRSKCGLPMSVAQRERVAARLGA